jgi:hypothetical protein
VPLAPLSFSATCVAASTSATASAAGSGRSASYTVRLVFADLSLAVRPDQPLGQGVPIPTAVDLVIG